MIQSVKLNNLRCFRGIFTIPLKRFNLVYGSNGAGKSSLLEAVQLGITGTSYRTQEKKIRDMIREIRCVGTSSFFIKLIDKTGKVITEFNDAGSSKGYTELLKLFYKKGAHHKTAQDLLKTLFTTHNLITQEKIVKLLDSENTTDFDTAVKEMIAGHELLERWSKFETLLGIIDKSIRDINEKISKERVTLKDYEKDSKEWDQISDKEVFNKYESLVFLLEQERFRPCKTDFVLSLEAILEWIRPLRISIEEIKRIVSILDERDDRGIYETKTLENNLESECKKINDHVETIDKLENIIKEADTHNDHNLKSRLGLLERLGKLGQEVKSGKELLLKARMVNEWRHEINADLQTKNMKENLIQVNMKIDSLQKVSNIVSKLPAYGIFQSTVQECLALEQQMNVLNIAINDTKSDIIALNKRLNELQKRYNKWIGSKNEQLSNYEKIFNLAKNIIEKQDDSKCPTCGTDFGHREILFKVIDQTFLQKSTSEPGAPELLKEIDDTKSNISTKQSTLDVNAKSNLEIETKLNENQTKISSWLDEASFIKLALVENKISELDDPYKDYQSFISGLINIDLKGISYSLREQQNKMSYAISTAWDGLRKDQFEGTKHKVEYDPNWNNLIINEKEWLEYLEELERDVNNTILQLNIEQNSLISTDTDIERISGAKIVTQTDIDKLRSSIKATEKDIKKISLILESIKKLQAYFMLPGNLVNIKDISNSVSKIDSQIGSLEQSTLVAINVKKRKTEYINRIGKIKSTIKGYEIICEVLSSLKSKEAFIGLETRINDEWDTYSNSINTLFKKLHSPPDFDKIELDKMREAFQVVPKNYPTERMPATVLSSGQRAALAISIFMTLNLSGINIPPIILMDEPIQQIDDLNSLNFLDTLRWIVENTDRQLLISTANNRIAGLIRRKFSYLGEQYNELQMERHQNMPPIIRFLNHKGDYTAESKSA